MHRQHERAKTGRDEEKRQREEKRKKAADKLNRTGGEYKTQAALGKARSKAMTALPSDPLLSYNVLELIKFESCNLMLIILNCSTGPRRWRWAC